MDESAAVATLQETNTDLRALTEEVCTSLPDPSAVNLAITDDSSNERQMQRQLLARYHWLGGRIADMQASCTRAVTQATA